jgi:hypothetical protein
VNIRKEVHYTISPAELRQIIADAIKSKFGSDVDVKTGIEIVITPETGDAQEEKTE